jgi:opacity protein-like surface antigen
MAISSALAADASPDDPGQSASLFRDGQYELSLNTGVLFSPFLATGGRPTINYTITEVQLGYMLSEVHGESWHRGNLELVGEVFGSAIFKGSGNYIAGATLWLRYNFVPEKCLVVPYVQGGAGLTTTDIDPGIVGQAFNFNLEIGAGTRVLLNRNWALNLECRFQHVSNANTGRHNLGINSIGPIAGVSYLF